MKTKTAGWSLKNYITSFEESSYRQTSVSDRYSESLLSFRHGDVINGNISTFITPGMEVSKLTIQSDRELVVTQCDEVERYISTFVYKGNMQAQFPQFNKDFNQTNGHHSFLHLANSDSQHTLAAGDTSILYLNMKPEWIHAFMPDWEQYSEKLSDKKIKQDSYISPAYSVQKNARLQQLLSAFHNHDFSGAARHLFLEAKAMELLALQLQDVIEQAELSLSNSSLISKRDYDKLMAMYEYINRHYLEPLSLSMLARKFLLNEFKLKKGFRQLFKQSAFHYIHTLRMQKAQELLRSGDRLVNEVSDMVGYSSIHNFSNAFYKMYKNRPNTIKPDIKRIAV